MNKLRISTSQKWKICFGYIFLALVAVLICTKSHTCLLFPSAPYKDSSVFRYVAYVMKKGGIAYRDTFDHKGPVLYLINYLGLLINLNGVWIFEVIFMLANCILTYRLLRKFCSYTVSVIGTAIVLFQIFSFFSGGNRVQEYALPFTITSLLIFVHYFTESVVSRGQLFVCGVCFMCTLMLREDLTVLWPVFSFAVLLNEIRTKQHRLGEYILFFSLGSGTVLLLVIMYFGYHNALKDFWEQYVVFNLKYTGTDQANYLPAVWFYCTRSPVIISIILSVFLLLFDKDYPKLVWLSLSYTIVNVLVTALSGRESSYYSIVFIPVTIIPISLTFRFLSKKNYWGCLILAGVTLLIASIPWINHLVSIQSQSTFYTSFDHILGEVLKTATDSDDRIAVCGNNDILYLHADRMAASKYSYQLPIIRSDPGILPQFIHDLEDSQPAVVVLCETYMKNSEEFDELKKEVLQFIEKNNYYEWLSLDENAYFVFGKKPYIFS